jgi:hypothetical protein
LNEVFVDALGELFSVLAKNVLVSVRIIKKEKKWFN